MNYRCNKCNLFHCICIPINQQTSIERVPKQTIEILNKRNKPNHKKINNTQQSSQLVSEQDYIKLDKNYITGSLVFLNQQLTTLQETLEIISNDLDN
mgnify:CR=1 FL=1